MTSSVPKLFSYTISFSPRNNMWWLMPLSFSFWDQEIGTWKSSATYLLTQLPSGKAKIRTWTEPMFILEATKPEGQALGIDWMNVNTGTTTSERGHLRPVTKPFCACASVTSFATWEWYSYLLHSVLIGIKWANTST